jgi:hypothetical protein
MFNKIKYINILVSPLILGFIFLFLLADAPFMDDDVVNILSPARDSTNKSFLMEGKMFHKSYKNSYFEEGKIINNYDIYNIKVKYTYAGFVNEVSAKGTGYHFSAWIDLSSITNPGSTTVTYSFHGQFSLNKSDNFIQDDVFTTIVTN